MTHPLFRLATRCVVAIATILLAASTASADTVKVIVDRALVWTRPNGTSVVITQLRKDDTAEVVRKVDGWYQILIPSGALSTEVRTGYISSTQVVVESTGPLSPEARRALTPPPPPVRRGPGTSFLLIDGVKRRGKGSLTQTVTVFSKQLDENSTISTNYGDTTGWSFDFMGGGPVWRLVGVGFGVGYHQRDRAAVVNALIPHPYFYDTFRPASYTTEPLRARETTFNFSGVFVPPMLGPVKLLAFGGLTAFRLAQNVVTDIALNEQYPYDTVSITKVTIVERKGTFAGYHAGADVSVFLNRLVGVGGGVRYSHANVKKFEEDNALTTEGIAGGTSVVAGVRFRF